MNIALTINKFNGATQEKFVGLKGFIRNAMWKYSINPYKITQGKCWIKLFYKNQNPIWPQLGYSSSVAYVLWN